MKMFVAACAIAAAAIAAVIASGVSAQNTLFSTLATVVDGDTLRLPNGERVRLWGIDAPEIGQVCHDPAPYDCGVVAAAKMRQIIGGAPIQCQPKDRDQYGRLVALCVNVNGDIAGQLVNQGYALDYHRYSGGYYQTQEHVAASSHVGMWAGTFTKPWEYRHHHASAR